MIIDAKDLIIGRMATVVAKEAMRGNKVDVINCEESVVSGKKESVLADYKQTYARGIPRKGPFHHSMPDRLVKRLIRGMIPYKKERGKAAYQNIRCFVGVPEELKDQKAKTISEAAASKLPNMKYMKIKEISKILGAKI